MKTILLALAALLVACGGDTTTDSKASGDTGSVTDSAPTDAQTSGDTSSSGDTGTKKTTKKKQDLATISFAITGEFKGTALTVQPLELDVKPGKLPGPGAVFGSTTVTSATPSVELADPPAADRAPLEGFEGVDIATYVVALHTDDGDERIGKGEVYTAVGTSLLAWLGTSKAQLPLALRVIGATEGWNVFDLEDESIRGNVKGDLADVPLEVVPTVASFTISGTYDLDDTPGFALVPENAIIYNSFPDALLYDAPMSAKWQIDVVGSPPKQNQINGHPFLPDGSAQESPYTYSDVDTSGTLTNGDSLLQHACDAKGSLIDLVYLPPHDNLLLMLITGGRTGWMAQIQPPATEKKDPDAIYADGPLTDLTLCEP